MKVVSERYGRRIRALVLTGSISRGEPALLINGRIVSVLGDADFITVFEDRSAIPQTEEMQFTCKLAEAGAGNRNVRCKIGISAVHPKFLRKLQPNIFTLELATYGRVVSGDPMVLCLIPPMRVSEIPLEDAWRMLCNRIVEVLEVVCATSAATPFIPLELQYRLVKLWLDMATSFLVFAGSYAPTYREREQTLRRLAANHVSSDEWPFSLFQFSSAVTDATRWRVTGVDDGTQFSDWQILHDTVKCARALWRWELCRLTASSSAASDRQLWQKQVDNHSIWQNVRGWLHLLRNRGWHRSIRQWPHWLRLGCSASPRSWIYRTGSEAFFQLPAMLFNSDQTVQPRLRELFDTLPESRCSRQVGDWRHLTAEIARNYNEFVVTTRS